MIQEKEIWETVKDFENYEVSNLGRVRRKEYSVTYSNGRVHKYKQKNKTLTYDKDGYLVVGLWISQKKYNFRVHRLVANAFIENKENKPQVNHINGVKNDNIQSNLEWCTESENRIHSYATGLQSGKNREGIKNNFCKLNDCKVIEIRRMKKSNGEIAKIYNVSRSNISQIKNNRTWKHLL